MKYEINYNLIHEVLFVFFIMSKISKSMGQFVVMVLAKCLFSEKQLSWKDISI